jgi:hypothetical protein
MRSVSYKSILHGVITKMGEDPATNVQQSILNAINEHVNERVKEMWESFPFPEWQITDRRTYRSAWTASTTYVAGQEVYDVATDQYYCALLTHAGQAPGTSDVWAVSGSSYSAADYDAATAYAAGDRVYYIATGEHYQCHAASTGNVPTDAAYWGRLVPLVRNIALAQTGQTAINMIFGVYASDPRRSDYTPELNYDLTADGIVLPDDAPARVWITYQTMPPVFTAVPWAAGTYVAGDRVYLASTGLVYVATGTTTASPPGSAWAVVEFPAVLSIAARRGAYADTLREDGQGDKAASEDARAYGALEEEFIKVTKHQNQRARYAVRRM